ncbi:DUF418 domain-containing protein [Mobilicoccus caccae]|uniref:DUF418 domain-containing protein n=1 Tax=Mobilicoccus caccae TaxID=1859295 RepID=A0ABQ6IR52_9MICO|nr:DUF418 domain-containing protein [Mobilicoccus caccae]GMA39934.1 hypothetical protein GCM10025883_19790 [Mobilicoccus caccae]
MTAPPLIPAGSTKAPGSRRLPALDVLRGLAILGTLLTNIWIFTSPTSPVQAAISGKPVGEVMGIAGLRAGDAGSYLQTGLNLVTDGKFIGLLTIMFGIGLEIQRQAAIRRGEEWPGGYPWRAGLLILDGLLNYIFIFEYDVLMGYGLTGLAVCFILGTSKKAQKIWMVVGITLHLLFVGFMSAAMMPVLEKLYPGGGSVEGDEAMAVLVERAHTQGWSEAQTLAEAGRQGMDPNTVREQMSALNEALAAGAPGAAMQTEVYWDQVLERLQGFWGGRSEIPIMFFMGLGLFLVGAHLYRAGLFLPHGDTLRKRVMLLSFGIGLPIDWACRLFFAEVSGGFPRYVTSTLVSFGLLSLVAHIYARRESVGPIGRPFELVGKMALTCYIGQNLLCSILFYDWGFGLANKMPQENSGYWVLLVYVGLCAFLVAFSAVWLRMFSRGPVELVWHASYEAIMKRRGPAIARRAEKRAERRRAKAEKTGETDKVMSSAL